MQTHQESNHPYPVIAAGPDYITATAAKGSASLAFEQIADREIEKKRDARGAIRVASLMGYQGYQLDHMYFGRRYQDSMIRLSGPETPYLAKELIAVATNVSRLDLQVTIYCENENPDLASLGYRHLTMFRRLESRPGQLQLITTDPKGRTLNVNKRTSDFYGRLYDKASEAQAGPPLSIWRYELEIKRRAARSYAARLGDSSSMADFTKTAIHSWWTTKGLEPRFDLPRGLYSIDHSIERPSRDVLRWFEQSVSVTVARAVKNFGLGATVQALGLSALVQPIRKEGNDGS